MFTQSFTEAGSKSSYQVCFHLLQDFSFPSSVTLNFNTKSRNNVPNLWIFPWAPGILTFKWQIFPPPFLWAPSNYIFCPSKTQQYFISVSRVCFHRTNSSVFWKQVIFCSFPGSLSDRPKQNWEIIETPEILSPSWSLQLVTLFSLLCPSCLSLSNPLFFCVKLSCLHCIWWDCSKGWKVGEWRAQMTFRCPPYTSWKYWSHAQYWHLWGDFHYQVEENSKERVHCGFSSTSNMFELDHGSRGWNVVPSGVRPPS